MKDKVVAFMDKEPLCVVSSLNGESRPQAALVAFTHSDKLELLIGTSNQTRKFQNLVANPNIAVVIGFSGDANIQYEGTTTQIDKKDLESLRERGFAELPGKDKYRQDPTEAWFLISPSWLRFTVHGDEDVVEETRDF
jgi:hypothetical protein